MTNVLFSGILPALVTPLTERETINEDVARRLMRWHMDEGELEKFQNMLDSDVH